MTNRHILSSAFLILLMVLAGCPVAVALDAGHYASTSALAQGRWMKVRVDADGLYRIPTSTLRAWGFDNPQRVRVFGYGGYRTPDALTAQNYIDDLPMAPCELTDRGLVFWAYGPGTWRNTLMYTHYEPNIYDAGAYYFIGVADEGDTSADAMPGTGRPQVSADADRTYSCRLHHEQEISLATDAGPLMVGEDFRFTRSRKFDFDLVDAVEGSTGRLECSFISTCTEAGLLTFAMDDNRLGAFTLREKSSDKYVHGNETVARLPFDTTAGRHTFSLTTSGGGSVTTSALNYLSLNYERHLRLPSGGCLDFTTSSPTLALGGASEDMRLWDVTNGVAPASVRYVISEGEAHWAMDNRDQRRYVAWRPQAELPAPKVAGSVAAQNLHGEEGAQMIIISPAAYAEAAQRLASFHTGSATPLSVKIVDPVKIYNEFSGGMADVSGLRKYLKMLYDRGAAGQGPQPEYVILMGRSTLDNRRLSAGAPSYATVPAWMPTAAAASMSDNDCYSTDDFIAMLADGSGADMGRDKLSLAVGRIPATDLDEANAIVDKIIQYAAGARKTAWKQRFLFVADDGDKGEHLRQTENMISKFENADAQQHLVRKVYVDNYTLQGAIATMARETMYRHLDEGVVWWNYIGHANETSWTSEGILTYTDLNNMYLRHWPFIYAATCDFLRFDAPLVSGAELLFKERYGGAIGVISAIRPVYITYNKYFSNAMGRALALRNDNGMLPTPGQMYMHAKNDIRDDDNIPRSDENRLRFVFIGDPALPLATPSNIVRVDRIKNLDPADNNNQIIVSASETAAIEGSVVSPDGAVLTDFDGVVLVEIFDAERSFTTQGHGETGTNDVFDDLGERVYCGSARVNGGRFSLDVAMPAELSQNFRQAAMSLFAYATGSNDEAIGLERRFYVYGYDETAAPDTEAPCIESLVLNHSGFRNGDTVNDSPMIIATLSDNVGINVSSAGVGRQMTAIIDGTQTYSDVANYYTPSADGVASGVINYPLEGLHDGPHTLRLRVWDTAGNSETAQIDFVVSSSLQPTIYEVYSDANPAVEQANFYLRHDQPDVMATVEITVYSLMGRKLWSRSVTGRSDMFLTIPVSWNLCDMGGRRVERGIYLYRATITTDGQSYQTASRRIAVAAQP